MRILGALCFCGMLVSPGWCGGQTVAVDPGQFQVATEEGAEAQTQISTETPAGPKIISVTISRTGPEFWSVELRAPGVNFQAGKEYELTFRAKSSSEEYIYLVPEKTDGNQASVAEGTTLAIPEQWTPCSVSFRTTDSANPGRLTISDLSVNPGTFSFADFRLVEK